MYKTHFLLKLKRSSDKMRLFAKVKLNKRIIGAKYLEVQSISRSHPQLITSLIVCCNLIDKSKRYTNVPNLRSNIIYKRAQIGVMTRDDIVLHFFKYLQIQRSSIDKDFIDEILIEILTVDSYTFSDKEEASSFIQLVIYHDQP